MSRLVLVLLSLFVADVASAAAPDPGIAVGLSAGSTLLPIGGTAALLLTGRGKDEDLRFDLGLGLLATGSIVGPSVGQIYASGGGDAVVTFILRTITASLMTVGVGLALRSDDRDVGTALAVLGGVPTAALAAWDIAGAASSARAVRYRQGFALLTPELLSVAACGPIPCAP